MHPFLIDFGEVSLPLLGEVRLALPTYGALVALAIVVAWLLYLRLVRREDIPVEPAASVAFWTLVAGLVGGKLGLVLVDAGYFLASPRRIFSVELLTSAGVVWAAILAGLAALALLSRRHGLPTGRLLDAAAVTVPIAQSIGRLGCLMAGCCYGGACSLPWAVVYHSHDARARTGVPLGVPLHPAPVYELLWSLAVVLPAVVLARRWRRRPGEALLAFLVFYGAGRFAIEFFRGDVMRGMWFDGTLSSSQVLSILVAPAALAVWIAWRRGAEAADEASRTARRRPAKT